MKKSKKLLLTTLIALSSSALMLASCDLSNFSGMSIPQMEDEEMSSVDFKGDQGEQGEKGDQGEKGEQGEQGPQGEKGQDGTSVLTGNGNPSTALGKDGDSYINLSNWEYFVKENGTWISKGNIKGDTGSKGETGDDGHTPTVAIGENGNWFIDNVDTGIHAKGDKGDDGHSPSVVIGENGNWFIDNEDTGIHAQGEQGVAGVDGTAVLTGHGAPASTLGKDGDSYINLDNWGYYVKAEGEWILEGNIKGDRGDAPLDHTHQYTTEIVNSTCTENGYVTMVCDICGHLETSVLQATGHSYGSWYEVMPATCESEGTKKKVCTSCGDTVVENTPMHEHEYSANLLHDTTTHWSYCTTCGIKHGEENHGNADGVCPICNYAIPAESESGFIFVLRSDGESYCLADLNGCTDAEITVPGEYNGKPVKEVSSAAFVENMTITSVVLPDGLETINNDSFRGCTNLQTINIPQGVRKIGKYAFKGCTSLETITLPFGLQVIDEYAFRDCQILASIVIPDTTYEIGWGSFENCYGLESLTLGAGLIRIRSYAFIRCSSLQSIVIPEMVESIEGNAFAECPALANVYFEDITEWKADSENVYSELLDNPTIAANYLRGAFTARNWVAPRVVYYPNEACDAYSVMVDNKDNFTKTDIVVKSTINGLPVTKIKGYAFRDLAIESITLPTTLKEIEGGAFGYCNSLSSLTLPEGLEKIGYCAFEKNLSLETLVIPSTVTTIGDLAFYDMENTTIYVYPETRPEDWHNRCFYYVHEVVWGYTPAE